VSTRFSIALPAGYVAAHALAFHGRDAEGPAERVQGTRIRKAIVLDGVPTLLDLAIHADHADCAVEADGPVPQRAHAALVNMLGLAIDPAPFAALVQGDALFAPLVRRHPGLRVIQAATVFEALTWAVIGQQINLAFAVSLRRSFIELAGRTHTGGLLCYPEAADVARLDADQLGSRKFSRAKAETLLRLARLAADGDLDLEGLLDEHGAAGAAERLLAIKGIGPWTVNYALLRGYGYPDCSLHGDVAVRNAIGRLLGGADGPRPHLREAEAFLLAYRPQRTMAAAYCWASLGDPIG
jgi:DNA-3-methyladenine glycosylase II